MSDENKREDTGKATEQDRRTFLESCGRFAIITPPAVTMLLSTTMTSDAIAHSSRGSQGRSHGKSRGGSHGNNGFGNGGNDGVPGRSKFQDSTR